MLIYSSCGRCFYDKSVNVCSVASLYAGRSAVCRARCASSCLADTARVLNDRFVCVSLVIARARGWRRFLVNVLCVAFSLDTRRAAGRWLFDKQRCCNCNLTSRKTNLQAHVQRRSSSVSTESRVFHSCSWSKDARTRIISKTTSSASLSCTKAAVSRSLG